MFRDKKLLERSIGLVMLELGLHIEFTELLYISIEAWLEIFVVN